MIREIPSWPESSPQPVEHSQRRPASTGGMTPKTTRKKVRSHSLGASRIWSDLQSNEQPGFLPNPSEIRPSSSPAKTHRLSLWNIALCPAARPNHNSTRPLWPYYIWKTRRIAPSQFEMSKNSPPPAGRYSTPKRRAAQIPRRACSQLNTIFTSGVNQNPSIICCAESAFAFRTRITCG